MSWLKRKGQSWHYGLAGVTLVELLVVIILIAIGIIIAIPNYQSFLANRQIRASTDLLVSSIQLAKSEAHRSNIVTSICPLASAQGSVCGGATDWNNGWIVYQGLGSAPQILHRYPAPVHALTFTTENVNASFNALGHLLTTPVMIVVGSAACSGDHQLALSISQVGLVSITEQICSS